MNRIISAFLLKLTFQRELGITVALGILLLALFSSVAGSWLSNVRMRDNLVEQGLNITENLARQSTLALLYASADNAAEAASATLDFPGVIGVEILEANHHVLLRRGALGASGLEPRPADNAKTAARQTRAVLDAENQNAWRFSAAVYTHPSTASPFNAEAPPELLGYVFVVMSKASLAQMTTGIFVANLATSLSFALLLLLVIRYLAGRMTRPLNELSACMKRAEGGESQVRAELSGPKDIADMAHSFNSMMEVLEERAAQIQRFNSELELRVSERTAELEAANKELEAFSYSASHVLRTPLRAIAGFSRLLLDDYAGKLDDEGKRLLNVVRENAGWMGQLIDDILKFSRTGRIEINASPIDMEALAREVADELRPQPPDGEVQIEIGRLPPLSADRAMMRQVFANLLSNALKYRQAGTVARIAVGGAIEGDESVYFVSDNGIGFDMQYVGKLFGVFQRLHGVDEYEGTGIGLAIVKRIVVRHGGRVWAEGKPGEGATFYFAFPLTKEKSHG